MLLVAHRTPRSAAACQELADAGAALFEADVQLDDHDRIVVSHFLPWGPWGRRGLQRDNWRIRWHSQAAADPVLADVVGLVPLGCRISLDMKERTAQRRDRLVGALIAELPDPRRFVVCGGRSDHLDRLRAAGFRTWRSAGRPRELRELLQAGPLNDDAVSVRHSLLTADVVSRLQAQGPKVVAWTVNSVDRARRMRQYGVDGVTTDRADVLRFLASAAN